MIRVIIETEADVITDFPVTFNEIFDEVTQMREIAASSGYHIGWGRTKADALGDLVKLVVEDMGFNGR